MSRKADLPFKAFAPGEVVAGFFKCRIAGGLPTLLGKASRHSGVQGRLFLLGPTR